MDPSSSSATGSKPLNCKAQINVGRLAGAVAARVREEHVCEVDTVGPEALHKALKAVVMASRYLGDDLPGKRLAVIAERRELPANGNLPATVLFKLRVAPLPDLPPSDEPDLYVGRDANPGLIASPLSKKLKNKEVVTISGMGALAMSKAFKAIGVAGVYLSDVLDKGEFIAAMPREQTIKLWDEERVRMLLICRRVAARAFLER